MDILKDQRIVLTLDAGGTNFVFSATRGGNPVMGEIRKNSNAHDLDLCIQTMKDGFSELLNNLKITPVAISFAFPGPADYPNGIIGDLNNLPAFRGGVPLKSVLEEAFNLPVFINNDGDLYAYGEALGGILPEINGNLEKAGSPKRYHNLVGLTLGTGFGGGLVRNGELFIGDNSTAAEVWLFSNRYNTDVNAEDVVSTRSVQMEYAKQAGIEYPNDLMPRDIYNIAIGNKKGNSRAAKEAYRFMGRALGDTVANLLTFVDGILVIGGGITGARDLYMPSVMEELNTNYHPSNTEELSRLVQRIFNLDDELEQQQFYRDYSKEIPVPGTGKTVNYDPIPRLGIATSRIGASKAIAMGAYAFALRKLDE
ncbi:MAG: ROK family protein [Bacteroidales bacterium]|nr:ROK family protein [Bacteroidales bacterium]